VESLCSSESDEEKDDGTSAALVVWRDDSPAESGSKKEEEDSNSAAVAVRQDESAAEEQLSSPERLKVRTVYRDRGSRECQRLSACYMLGSQGFMLANPWHKSFQLSTHYMPGRQEKHVPCM